MRRLDADHIVGLEPSGEARILLGSDGSMQRVPTPGEGMLMGGVPLPEHLGQGFLFWDSEALYRARTFTGTLEPIASVSTNAIGVEFGPSSVLLFTPDGPPRAYALDPARRVPSSPHGVLEIAAADANRAVAFDAAGRALATVDGGRSWKDVTATLGEAAHGLRREEREVGFVLEREHALLQKDGNFVRRPQSETRSKPPEAAPFDPVRDAIERGVPLSTTHALLVGNGILEVDLESGQTKKLAKKLPFGSSCSLVSASENALLVCYSHDKPANTLAVVSGALGEHPNIEKTFQQPPTKESPVVAISEHVLVIGSACSGASSEGVACVRSFGSAPPAQGAKPAAWNDVNIQAALGTTWEVLHWVPTEKGWVAALVVEKHATGPSPRLALIDAASGVVMPFDATFDRVAPRGFAQDPRGFVVSKDGTLHGFTNTAALSVNAQGHVSPTRAFKNVASAAAFALAQDDADRLWQTKDYGEHWVEVARPPFEPQIPSAPPGSFRGQSPRSIRCSLVGCILGHESGLGAWLRFGWPIDPPRAQAAVAENASRDSRPSSPASEPIPPRPKLRCVSASASPVPAGPPRFALTTPTAATIQYGDVFSHETILTHGLRGIVRIPRTDSRKLAGALELVAATKAPFEVELTSPLDPAAGILRSRGSFAAWIPLLKDHPPDPDGNTPRMDLFRGSTRPLLSALSGRAEGVLFVNDDFAFAVTRSGKLHPIRPGCRPDSGYVDAHGTLFVACGSDSGSTAVGDADHHTKLFRLPPTDRFRYDSGEGMRFFEPGRQLLNDPDAIAVAPDGKLAILRTASGDAPPTIDTPAWLLSADAPPIELAPWSTLEPASSPACAKDNGYRALIQTGTPWIDVEGAAFTGTALGMSAIVRWSAERVCLESVEIGLGTREAPPAKTDPKKRPQSLDVMLVARFASKDANAAFVGSGVAGSVREPAKCALAGP